jgi:hypothetical protein
MSKILLIQLDGKLPNLALMRLSSHHFMLGDSVEFRNVEDGARVERYLGDDFDKVYASTIFAKSKPLVRRLLKAWPDAIVGGSGWDEDITLEKIGVETQAKDYRLYPDFRSSIGYTQRGCRLKCWFCGVPRMEGPVKFASSIGELWRGDGHPREMILLDNDFFGEPSWPQQIDDLRTNRFKVSFCQGINVRMIGDEQAAAIASVNYQAISMKTKRLYCAWDNRRDESRLFRGLELLTKHGVKPDHLMVYILIGADHQARGANPCLAPDDFYRHAKLREFGARPYPMPYARTPELEGFQRWIVKRIDLMGVSWEEFTKAKYRPERFGVKDDSSQMRLAFGD